MALVGRPSYAMPFSAASLSPASSTTYYIGGAQSVPTTVATIFRQYVTLPSVIRMVQLVAFCTVAGSAETGSIYLRLNGTTDFLVSSTFKWNASLQAAFNNPYDSPLMTDEVSLTDYWEIKIVTPAWLTPPIGVLYWGNVIFAGDY